MLYLQNKELYFILGIIPFFWYHWARVCAEVPTKQSCGVQGVWFWRCFTSSERQFQSLRTKHSFKTKNKSTCLHLKHLTSLHMPSLKNIFHTHGKIALFNNKNSGFAIETSWNLDGFCLTAAASKCQQRKNKMLGWDTESSAAGRSKVRWAEDEWQKEMVLLTLLWARQLPL